jgi:hypothetical protein
VTRGRLLSAGAVLLALAALAFAFALGRGAFGAHEGAGEIAGATLPERVVTARAEAQRAALEKLAARLAAQEEAAPREARAPTPETFGRSAADDVAPLPPAARKSILFGDLHVHTSVSMDAFLMSLPIAGGEGAHPAADACDFARYCSALDFWSINDHAESITPQLWRESLESIRQCNAVAGSTKDPDLVSYLGWEWTQVGATPEEHWGHRNVILRDLADSAIPARPIAAEQNRVGGIGGLGIAGRAAMVAMDLFEPRAHDFALKISELRDETRCPASVPTRDLPRDCLESAATPAELFAKLRDWKSAALVIPHGTAWGNSASPLASWDTQLGESANDPELQRLVEVYSGHGNSEEYRAWRPVVRGPGGARECPAPSPSYMPLCWRAGEIIERRCLAQGGDAVACAERAAETRHEAANAAHGAEQRVVPLATGDDWGDAGQCRDCFLPAYSLRPLLSVQYALALTSFANPEKPWRYRFGFVAASDSHSARPGTGYKEFARRSMADGQLDGASRSAWNPPRDLPARSKKASEVKPATLMEMRSGPPDDRIGAFLFTGGLVAVHSASRDRGAIWDSLARREVYGTSGQRTLLWFDLLNAPDGALYPMGSEVRLRFAPSFRVRAIGSPKQKPGCPPHAASALAADRLERLCRGECFYPSDERHRITRIEVVRIRPQQVAGEPIEGLIEDPWRTFPCEPSEAGCVVEFADPEFAVRARDAVYYVRAIEEPTLAVNGKGLGCKRDAQGGCVAIDATPSGPSDDRSGEVEERAWSSPIFVDYAASADPAMAAAASADGAEAGEPGLEPPFQPVPQGELDPAWSEAPNED